MIAVLLAWSASAVAFDNIEAVAVYERQINVMTVLPFLWQIISKDPDLAPGRSVRSFGRLYDTLLW